MEYVTEMQLIAFQSSIWRSSLRANEKLLLLALMTAGWGAQWPSAATLSAYTGLGRRTVFSNIASLERKKVIRRTRVPGYANEYDLSAVFAMRLPFDDYRPAA